MKEKYLIILLIASTVLFVLVGTVTARTVTFASPLPPVCPKGQTCDGSYLPWRPTPQVSKDKEPTATPQVSVLATPHLTAPAVTVTRRVTRSRYWPQ
jgi:hypothetical protein